MAVLTSPLAMEPQTLDGSWLALVEELEDLRRYSGLYIRQAGSYRICSPGVWRPCGEKEGLTLV